jgi:hypothetical protein
LRRGSGAPGRGCDNGIDYISSSAASQIPFSLFIPEEFGDRRSPERRRRKAGFSGSESRGDKDAQQGKIRKFCINDENILNFYSWKNCADMRKNGRIHRLFVRKLCITHKNFQRISDGKYILEIVFISRDIYNGGWRGRTPLRFMRN